MQNMKCVIIPIVTGATAIVTKGSKKSLKAIPRKHSMDLLQKTAMGITADSREVPGREGLWEETHDDGSNSKNSLAFWVNAVSICYVIWLLNNETARASPDLHRSSQNSKIPPDDVPNRAPLCRLSVKFSTSRGHSRYIRRATSEHNICCKIKESCHRNLRFCDVRCMEKTADFLKALQQNYCRACFKAWKDC